jgi:hypothetical protein
VIERGIQTTNDARSQEVEWQSRHSELKERDGKPDGVGLGKRLTTWQR